MLDTLFDRQAKRTEVPVMRVELPIIIMFPTSVVLTPEYRRVVGVLEEALSTLPYTPSRKLPDVEELLREGYLSLHPGPLVTSDLPHGFDWIWNQNRGKKVLTTTEGDKQATLIKLNTRSRTKAASPAVKVWIFNVCISAPTRRTYAILWCEKSESKTPTLKSCTAGIAVDEPTFPPVEDSFWDSFGVDSPFQLEDPWAFSQALEEQFSY
jgi:hypothetical protein